MKEKIIFAIAVLLLASVAGTLGYLVAPRSQSHSTFYAPAVTDNGQGMLVKFRVSLYPGAGRALVNIQNAKYREDSENALVKAKKTAETYLGIKLAYHDVILDVESIGSQVAGESAGAMFAVGIISAYTGKSVKSDVVMSAGITETGLLFAVDSIEEKILAAQASSKKRFVVANSQEVKNAENIKGIEIIKAADIREAAEQMLA